MGSGGRMGAFTERGGLFFVLLAAVFAAMMLATSVGAQEEGPESTSVDSAAASEQAQSGGKDEVVLETKATDDSQIAAAAEEEEGDGDLAGADATALDSEGDGDNLVDRIVVDVRDCTIGKGATITFRDSEGRVGTAVDGGNVFITSNDNEVIVRGDDPGDPNEPINLISEEQLRGSDLTVTGSTGIDCEGVGETTTGETTTGGTTGDTTGGTTGTTTGTTDDGTTDDAAADAVEDTTGGDGGAGEAGENVSCAEAIRILESAQADQYSFSRQFLAERAEVCVANVPAKDLPDTGGGLPLAGLLLAGFAMLVTGTAILRHGIRREE